MSAPGAAPAAEFIEDTDVRDGRQFVQNIIQQARFDHATFGISDVRPAAASPRTGPVSTVELTRLDAFYHRPDEFADLARRLGRDRLLLLTGRPGTGRRAAAIQLLRSAGPALPLVSWSPISTFADLGAKTLEQRGYLLADKNDEPEIGGADLDALIERLRTAKAFLVITMAAESRSSRVRAYSRPWPRIAPGELLTAYLDRKKSRVTAEHRTATLHRLPDDLSPSDVLRVGDRLVSGRDSADALGALSAENSARVTGWFDQDRTLGEVQFVTAMAFLSETGEPVFDRGLGELRTLMAPEPADGTSMAADAVLPQQRRNDFDDTGLARVDAEADRHGTTGRRVGLRPFVSHRLLITCLSERYGRQLWDPVTAWLRQLARRRALEQQAAVGRGVAELWKVDRAVAEQSFLTPWSKGTAAEQFTAVCTLWFLGEDDTTEDAALKIAVGWATGTATQRRCAIGAFTGSLGMRFPADALKWMWRSATTAKNPREIMQARTATTQLFVEAGEDDESLAALLRVLDRLVDKLPAQPLVRRDALHLVAAILDARHRGRHLPVVHLTTARDDRVNERAAVLGRLWARALVVRPVRGVTVAALCACLRELERAENGTTHLIPLLGRHLLAELPTERERDLLCRDVARFLPQIDLRNHLLPTDFARAIRAAF